MNIVIAGGGNIGFITAEYFSRERHGVTVIESQHKNVAAIQEHLDVNVVEGRSTDLSALEAASIAEADIFLALTDDDEANIISCILAKNLGVPLKICRLNDSFNSIAQSEVTLKALGIDEIVDSEGISVNNIVELIEFPGMADRKTFFRDEYAIGVFSFSQSSEHYGKCFDEIVFDFPVTRLAFSKLSSIKPYDGSRKVNEFLYLYIGCEKKHFEKLYKILYPEKFSVKNVMIYGSGYKSKNTALRLVERLKKLEVKDIVLVVDDAEEASHLSKNSDVPVIFGDPSRPRFRKSEDLKRYDAFIAISSNFEKNLFSCTMAYQAEVPLTISLVRFPEDVNFVSAIPLTSFLNPAMATTNEIMRYHKTEKIISRTILNYEEIECFEVQITANSWLANKTVKDLKLKNSKIAAIRRKNSFLEIEADTKLLSGDVILVFLFEDEKEIFKKLI